MIIIEAWEDENNCTEQLTWQRAVPTRALVLPKILSSINIIHYYNLWDEKY